MALTELQGDLLLDVCAARKSEDPNQLQFAIACATTHGVPQDQVDAVLAEEVSA